VLGRFYSIAAPFDPATRVIGAFGRAGSVKARRTHWADQSVDASQSSPYPMTISGPIHADRAERSGDGLETTITTLCI
jgi:hypothetical protein